MNPEQFSALAKVFPEALLLVSRTGEIAAANRPAAALVGHSGQDLQGMELQELLTDAAEDVAEYLGTCARGGTFSKQVLGLVRHDGRAASCRCEGALVRPRSKGSAALVLLRLSLEDEVGSQFSLLTTKIDALNRQIRRRKVAQANLKAAHDTLDDRVKARTAELNEMHDRLEAILDGAADGIVTIDEAGVIESVNRAAMNLFGYRDDELAGRSFGMLLFACVTNADDRASADSSATDVAAWVGDRREVIGQRKDGSVFPMDLYLAEVRIGGRPVYTGIIRDITSTVEAATKLEAANRELLETSRIAGMAEIATGALHNVGNILTSISVSAGEIRSKVMKSRSPGLSKVASLISQQGDGLAEFFNHDERGKVLPGYIDKLAVQLGDEREGLLAEMDCLAGHLDTVKQIIAFQQSCARVTTVKESLAPAELMDDVLRLKQSTLLNRDIRVEREFEALSPTMFERGKVLQILVNLISNAIQSMEEAEAQGGHVLHVKVAAKGDRTCFSVEDTGIGIPEDSIDLIFRNGYTTKAGGHGFGLHHSANAANELGGSLRATSGGPGCGATFRLEVPVQRESSSKRGEA